MNEVNTVERPVMQQWWSAHPLDKWGQAVLLEIAHSAGPPDTQPGDSPNWCGEVTLAGRDGWRVCFFYDCGELDYIDHFVTPDGERLDVWPDDYQSEQGAPVMNWRGTSDTERFVAMLHNAKVSGAGTASAGLPGYTLPCEET